jgi:CheY-like chemotaxis protein
LAIMQKDFHPVVFSDLNMPGMNGLELARQLHTRWPITILSSTLRIVLRNSIFLKGLAT